jgi:photosystem II stability/assembly factor-like uncharacterized protein
MVFFRHLLCCPVSAISAVVANYARNILRAHAVCAFRGSAALLLMLMSLLPMTTYAQPRSTTVAKLAETTHFHGLAVDRSEHGLLLLATHDGIYRVSGDGHAELLSQSRDDFMGFAPHPTNSSLLIGSGHPVGGGNLGFITSQDGGRTWKKQSDGVGGPVDFHQLAVSSADPNVMYGVFRGVIQRSADGGETWRRVGNAPEGLITLAASSLRSSWLYAATQTGLVRSGDGGRNWRTSYAGGAPTTLIHVTPTGVVYAYVIGQGFIKSDERDRSWMTLNEGFGASYLLHLAIDPNEPRQLFSIAFDSRAKKPAIWKSADGGGSWAALGGDATK